MSTRKRWTLFAVINAAALLAAPLYRLYLWLLPRLMPQGLWQCVCARFFHLYCPGCGGTRALGALFRFDLLGALRLNALVPLGAALFLYYDVRAAVAIARREPLAVRVANAVWIGVLIFLLLFTVGRNVALIACGYDPIGDLIGYWSAPAGA